MILSIVGIALTSITFGQLLSQEEGGMLFYRLSYNSASDRLEHYLSEVPERRASGDQFDAPLNSIIFFEPMEREMDVENWMTLPFETDYYEEELSVEDWMTVPFETDYYEEELSVEDWMTVPFETDYYEEELSVEPWMTEPFEISYHEAELSIEPWMTRPFILEEEIQVEDWMLSSWF